MLTVSIAIKRPRSVAVDFHFLVDFIHIIRAHVFANTNDDNNDVRNLFRRTGVIVVLFQLEDELIKLLPRAESDI
jgi:hypothetical protein